jgi:putative oxidoreductase
MNASLSRTQVVPVIGRSLIAALFLVAALRKLTGWDGTLAYMASKGLPMTELLLTLTILLEVGCAILLVVGWRTRWVAVALAAFTLAATLIFHAFWAVDPAQFSNQLNHFLKNIAIMGGLLVVAHASQESQPSQPS